MNPQAIELANRKYITVVQREPLGDGEYCYTARHPEFAACLSQGNTPAEAKTELVEATRMIIEHMLASGLPIPEPMALSCDTLLGEQPEPKPPIEVKQITGAELVFA